MIVAVMIPDWIFVLRILTSVVNISPFYSILRRVQLLVLYYKYFCIGVQYITVLVLGIPDFSVIQISSLILSYSKHLLLVRTAHVSYGSALFGSLSPGTGTGNTRLHDASGGRKHQSFKAQKKDVDKVSPRIPRKHSSQRLALP